MSTDQELLRQFAEGGSEAAFAEVVRRQVNFVYSTARRLAAQDTHLAEDITQRVFADLARKAGTLSRHPALAGWLHHCTRFHAFALLRAERRRRAREQKAFAMQDLTVPPPSEASWEQLCPLLDAALAELNAADREVLLQRFFQDKSHREIAETLGLNENSANKRAERALEKLRAYFSRRGVHTTTAALAAVISANSTQAAPAELVARLTAVSLAGIAGPGLLAIASLSFFLMNTKAKVLLGVAIAAVLVLCLHFSGLLTGDSSPASAPAPVVVGPGKAPAAVELPAKVMTAATASSRPAPAAAQVTSATAAPTATAAAATETPPLNADLKTAVPELIRLVGEKDYTGLVNYVIAPEDLAQMIRSGQVASREDFANMIRMGMEGQGGNEFIIQGLTAVVFLQQNPNAKLPGYNVTVKNEPDKITYAFETPLGHKDLVFARKNGLWYAFQQ